MSKIILFSSSKCPDCPVVIKKLEEENIEFENIDITDSMFNLKKFLKERDNNSYFDEIKSNNKVGVPTIMTKDGKFYNPENMIDFSILK